MLFEYLLLFFCTIPMTMLASPGLALLFKKANVDPKKAYIPIVNQLTFLKISGKHPANVILEFVPVINILSFALDIIDFARCFGVRTFLQQMATLFLYPVYFWVLGKDEKVKFLGNLKEVEENEPAGKWYSSLLFAVVAATIVRWAFIEAYKIPTSSMEGSMLVNDFLFVSKIHYGPRTPQTPLQVPLTHQQMPLLGIKSFSEAISLPSFRLPGLSEVKRGTPLVFNWPYDDNVKNTDMKTFYVKRCVALAGDSVKFVDGQLYVNGKIVEDNENVQYRYIFKTTEPVVSSITKEIDGNGGEIEVERLREDVMDDWDLVNNEDFHSLGGHDNVVMALLSKKNLERVKTSRFVDPRFFQKIVQKPGEVTSQLFPYHLEYKVIRDGENSRIEKKVDTKRYLSDELLSKYKFKWNVDNFGSLWIPKKGVTIPLDEDHVTLYASTIARYEGYERERVKVVGNKLLIDGQPQSSYTFKRDYYWLIGDNRHNSEDSRFWGFVPDDHVVGKPFITFFSINKYATKGLAKIRWNRIFRFVE